MTTLLRVLPRQSGPVLGAIAVIGIGIGLAAMVFALADLYVARPLPYADADRLVSIEFGMGDPTVRADQADVPSLASWQARTDLFEGLAAFDDVGWRRVQLTDRMVPLRTVAVTDNLLQVLGVDQRSVADAWISTRAATNLSGGELSVGQSVPLRPEGMLRVGGVLPPSFLFPQPNRTDAVDALVVLLPGPVVTINRSRGVTAVSSLHVIGRTRQGVTPEMIGAALRPVVQSIGSSLSVVALPTAMTARLRAIGRGAFLASALVIVICWMNVFNIALTRGLYRERELATRTALGATPSQLLRLMLSEGLRVATLGTACALAVTWIALKGAVGVLPAEYATLGVPSVTIRVAFVIAAAGSAAWLSWCLASVVAWRLGVRHHARRIVSRDGRAIRVMRFVLIAGQLGAASVLLAAAALLGRSYANLLLVDAGMDEQTQTFTVSHDPSLPPAVRSDVVARMVTALRRVEGVQAAGVRTSPMLDGRMDLQGFHVNGRFAAMEWTRVDRGFPEAAGLQFLAGGLPEPNHSGAVITQSMALTYFPGRSPIGAVLDAGRAVPIVGVVRDVRTRGLSVAPKPAVYEVGGAWSNTATFTYVVRSADRSQGLADWQRILRPIDPAAVVMSDATIGERLARSVQDRTFAALVIGLFATACILVTALGLAGVVAYTVVRRTREIAIRVTLGATRSSVTWLVARHALTAATCGAIGGVIASVWLSGALENLLYGIRPADPTTLLASALSLVAIVAGAAIVPAFRTGRIAPAITLRVE